MSEWKQFESEWDRAKSTAIEAVTVAYENCGFEFSVDGSRIDVIIPIMNADTGLSRGYDVIIRTELKTVGSRRTISDD